MKELNQKGSLQPSLTKKTNGSLNKLEKTGGLIVFKTDSGVPVLNSGCTLNHSRSFLKIPLDLRVWPWPFFFCFLGDSYVQPELGTSVLV